MDVDGYSKQAVTAVCLIPNVTSSVVAVLVLGRARQHPITPPSLSTLHSSTNRAPRRNCLLLHIHLHAHLFSLSNHLRHNQSITS